MGQLKIRFMLDGMAIAEPGYSSSHPLYHRPESSRTLGLFRQYPIGGMREIEFKGEDFVIEFNASDLLKEIDWTTLNYPSEQVRAQVLDLIYRQEARSVLREVASQWDTATSGQELERVTKEIIRLIESIKPKHDEEDYLSYKNDFVGSLLYTLNNEVDTAKQAKQRDRENYVNTARTRLWRDFFLHLSFLFPE